MPINFLRLATDPRYDPLEDIINKRVEFGEEFDGEYDPRYRHFLESPPAPKEEDQSLNIPALSPEEEESYIKKALGLSLSGLQIAADALDVPGRMVRGLLGGRPRELLSFIPFSDTLGITRQEDKVSGRDLLHNFGILNKHSEGIGQEAAGFLTELALDPLLFVGLAPLTKAGKAAAQSGKLALSTGKIPAGGLSSASRSVIKRLGKNYRTAAEAADLAQSAGKLAPDFASRVTAGQQGLLRLGLPDVFGLEKYSTVMGTGPKYGKIVEKYAQPAIDQLWWGNPISRTAGQLFRTQSGEMKTGYMQKLYEQEFVPKVGEKTKSSVLPLQGELHALQTGKGAFPWDDAHQKVVRASAEIGEKNPQLLAQKISEIANDRSIPAQSLNEAAKLGASLRQKMQSMIGELNKLGIDAGELSDEFVDYLFRQHVPDQWIDALGAFVSAVRLRHKTIERLPFLKRFKGGTEEIEDILHSHETWDFNNPKAATEFVESKLQHLKPKEAKNQAKAFVSWVHNVLGTEEYDKFFDPKTGAPNLRYRFFNQDPITDAIVRTAKHSREMANANFGHEALKLISIVSPAEEAMRSAGFITVGEALSKMGYRRIEAKPLSPIGGGSYKLSKTGTGTLAPVWRGELHHASLIGINDPTFIRVKSRKTGKKSLRVLELQNRWVPEEIVQDFNRVREAWKSPEAASLVGAAYDAALNLWKATSTQVWPRFHVRNFASGSYYNIAAGAYYPEPNGLANSIIDAWKLISGNPIDDKRLASMGYDSMDDLIVDAKSSGLLKLGNTQAVDATGKSPFYGATRPIPQAPQTAKSMASQALLTAKANIRQVKKLRDIPGFAKDIVNSWINLGQGLGNVGEELIRIAHFLGMKSRGYDSLSAMDSVSKWLFDYSDLTMTERQVAKRLAPFYTFARKNLPLVMSELGQRPGGLLAQSIRMANYPRQNEGFVPQYVGAGAAIRIPGYPGRFVSQFGLPFEAAFEPFGTGPTLISTIQRNAQGLLGQMTPPIKTFGAAAFGIDPFTGRELEDLYKYPTPSTAANLFLNAIGGSPISTARTIMDPRKEWWAKLINLGTGARITDVYGGIEQQKSLAARKITEQALKDTPYLRSFTRLFVPKEYRKQLPQDVIESLRLQKTLELKAKEAAKRMREEQAGAYRPQGI